MDFNAGYSALSRQHWKEILAEANLMILSFFIIFFSFYHERRTDMRVMDVVGQLCVRKCNFDKKCNRATRIFFFKIKFHINIVRNVSI